MWVRGQEGSHRFYTGGENVSRDSWRLLEASRRGKGDAKVENAWDGAWETKVNHQNVSIWCSSMETSGQEDDSSVLALHKTLDVGLCSWHLLLASALERPVQQMESEPKGMEIAWGHQKKKMMLTSKGIRGSLSWVQLYWSLPRNTDSEYFQISWFSVIPS